MKLKISQPKDKLKIIRRGDPDFYIRATSHPAPRAGFEIDSNCPQNTKRFLIECIENGWIKPVAYMKESEYIWERLS